MKQRGITLIEIMVVVAFALIIVSIGMGFLGATRGNVSMGINGIAESRCIEGYKFVIGEHGQPRQILDEFGKGVRCGNGL